MKSEVEKLFDVFGTYQITYPLENVGMFDFGPNDEELQGISKPLRQVPKDVVRSMEFYGYGWSSWGSEVEVKYFLPRILELISYNLDMLEDVFSLLKYKLNGALLPHSRWPAEEVRALRSYFISLLKSNLTKDIGYLIEGLIVVGFKAQEVLKTLKEATIDVQKKSSKSILGHFSFDSEHVEPSPVYVDSRIEEFQEICNWAYRLTRYD